uniref:Uncharacterized protein n=1 Tax=Arundo donax TaxID=35708 RepID=A0A0A9EAZ1_ARUDO
MLPDFPCTALAVDRHLHHHHLEDLIARRRDGGGGGGHSRRALGGRRELPRRRLPVGALGHHGQRHGHGRPAASAPPLAARLGRCSHSGRRRGRWRLPRGPRHREPPRRGAGLVAAGAEARVPDVVQGARVLGHDGAVGAAGHDHGPRVPRHAHRRRRLRPAQHPAGPHAAAHRHRPRLTLAARHAQSREKLCDGAAIGSLQQCGGGE